MTTSTSTRLSLLLATAMLAACPKVPDPDPLVPAPRVLSFTTSSVQVSRGDRVTLTWATENAESIKLEDVRFGAIAGVGATDTSGSVETAINDDTLFVLTARNARGVSDTAVVVVRVSLDSGELLFTVLPDLVQPGQSATLAWSAPGASSVSITSTPGGVVDLGGQLASGAVVVNPVVNTTYTLTANGRTATAEVRVSPALLSFTASPLSADAGATVTLSWQTANATRVQLLAPGRAPLLDETDPARVASGTFDDTLPAQVDPGQLFPYELLVTGPGTQLKDSLVVTLNGNPSITSFTAPALVRDPALPLADGGVSTATIRLAWTTRDVSSVTLSADGNDFFLAPVTAIATGTLDLPAPTSDTTYVLTARGVRGGAVSRSVTVDVVGLPTIALTASPTSTEPTNPVTLSWAGTNVRTVRISHPVDGTVFTEPAASDTGSTSSSTATSATYTVRAGNGVGDFATATADVVVTNPLTLTLFDGGVLRRGQNVSVSWTAPIPNTPMVGLPHTSVDPRPLAFDDISGTGTRLIIDATTRFVGNITTSFRTTLFGRPVGDTISVSEFGYLVFGELNGKTDTEAALPNAVIEPLAVSAYWDDLTFNNAFWQVKTVGGVQWLIVQWENSTASFQTRISALGQIDFDYRRMPTSVPGIVGVTGVRPDQFVAATASPDAGLTFFGPRQSPVTVPALVEGRVSGALALDGGQVLRLSATLDTVVHPQQLRISEVMSRSAVGAQGNWVEVANSLDRPLDLTGWTLGLADGGALPLTGSVPARGVLVLGATTDGPASDDAGITVAVPGFDLGGVSSLTFARAGVQTQVPLASDAGVTVTRESGVIRLSTGAVAPVTCSVSATYGSASPLQLGTPGREPGCGFPYSVAPTTPGFFDISGTGQTLTITNFDSTIVPVSLAAAPVPVFGAPRLSMQVSTNGFVTFDSAAASATNVIASSTPSTTDSNLVAAIFGDDLDDQTTLITPAAISVQRVAQGVDPFAAAPHWIVQWSHFSHVALSDDLNFQIKLFDDGAIEYHFGKMLSSSFIAYGSGSSTVTWLENETGTQALTINALSSNNPGLSPQSAFRFSPR